MQQGRRLPHGPAWSILVFFLLLPALVALPSRVEATNPGDWVVSGPELLENQVRIMNGSILIPLGATLTIRNSTIAFDLPSEGKYNITVETGGSLFLENVSVRSNVSGFHYNFIARGHLEVRHSDIADMRGDQGLGGLEVESGNMIMEDSVVHHNRYYGLALKSGSPVVRRTVFEANVVAVAVYPGATPTLEDLDIRNSTLFGLRISSAAPVVRNLTITGTSSFGIGINSGSLSVDGCKIVGVSIGIDATTGSTGGVRGCQILSTATGVRAQDSAITVANGTFFANGIGVNATRSNVEIIGNQFTDVDLGVLAMGPVEGPVGGEALNNHFEGDGVAFEVYVSSFFVQGNTYAPNITALRVFRYIGLVVVDKAGQPVAQARVNVTDLAGTRVFTGVTNETGAVVATLEQYRQFPNGTVQNLTPHAVTITRHDQVTQTTVNATADRVIQITLEQPVPPTTAIGVSREGLLFIGIVVAAIAAFGWAATRSQARPRGKAGDDTPPPVRRRGPRSGR